MVGTTVGVPGAAASRFEACDPGAELFEAVAEPIAPSTTSPATMPTAARFLVTLPRRPIVDPDVTAGGGTDTVGVSLGAVPTRVFRVISAADAGAGVSNDRATGGVAEAASGEPTGPGNGPDGVEGSRELVSGAAHGRFGWMVRAPVALGGIGIDGAAGEELGVGTPPVEAGAPARADDAGGFAGVGEPGAVEDTGVAGVT
jgi:hypothetical protein